MTDTNSEPGIESRASDDDERFRALARVAREGVLIHENGVIREINEAFTRIIGFERADVIGKDGLSLIIDPESRELIRKVSQSDQIQRPYAVVMRTKSGERRHVETASEPIVYQGRPMRVVTFSDMTERIALEAQRDRSAALLSGIIENTNQPIHVKDLEGRYLLANRAFCEQLGAVSLVGRHETEVVKAQTLPSMHALDEQALDFGAAVIGDLLVLTPRGPRTFLASKFPLFDEQGRAFALGGIATDVTDSRRASELLASTERRTAGAIGQAYFEALGLAMAEGLSADHVLVGELLPGQRRIRTLSMVAHGRLQPSVEYDLDGTPCETVLADATCVHSDGVQGLYPRDELLVEMGVRAYVGVPLRDSNGAALGILVAMFQRRLSEAEIPGRFEPVRVTIELFAARAAAELERVRATRILEHTQAELERRVAERTAELAAANAELETFAYSVSHDLRAPLRHIGGFVELLKARSAGLDAESLRFLDTIRRSATRMSTLVDDLLGFSRTGRAPLHVSRFSVGELVTLLVEELSAHRGAGQRDAGEVQWSIGPMPTLEADRGMLTQVLQNLMDNALKYSRHRRPARIELWAVEGPAEWTLSIRDNGAGFNPAYVDKLFGVFRRLHRDDEFEGNGIGLATVRRIVERHGGRVWAEGRLDEGASFHFTIPNP